MRQDWWHLLFLHWEVPAEQLRRRIPDELAIDTFHGRAFVGLVPFTMSGVRPWWSPPVPGLSRFHEVNVRTYVVPRSGGPPGVWFFSLDAANRLAVAVARRFWGLPYWTARMGLAVRQGPDGPRIEHRSERLGYREGRAHCAVQYRPVGTPAPAAPGTLDHFLVERYVLYCLRRGRLMAGRVHHEPYQVQGADVLCDESLIAAAGLERPTSPPLAHYAGGVRVRVEPLRVPG
jgi:uncharacterized protein YqjF (DUF2071 family)